MRVILTTENSLSALRLRNLIIKSVRGEVPGVNVKTWVYIKSGNNFDIVYHDVEQFLLEPEKNVLYKLEVDGAIVSFTATWWKTNPEPSREMICLHTGRLTEMLLRYFSGQFIKFSILDLN